MTTPPSLDQLLDLADLVAADGVAAHRPAVDPVTAWARVRGVAPVLVEVLDDRSTPDAVHQRALGRLIVAIARSSGGDDRRPGDPVPPARQLSAA